MAALHAVIRWSIVPSFSPVIFVGRAGFFVRLPDNAPKPVHGHRSRLARPTRPGALAAGTRPAGIRRRPCPGQRCDRALAHSIRQDTAVHGVRANHNEPLAHPVSATADEFQRTRTGANTICLAIFARGTGRATASLTVALREQAGRRLAAGKHPHG